MNLNCVCCGNYTGGMDCSTELCSACESQECPACCEHSDDLDHGVCCSCGKDLSDDLAARAEFAAECLEDR